jgi:hypothetical protein
MEKESYPKGVVVRSGTAMLEIWLIVCFIGLGVLLILGQTG